MELRNRVFVASRAGFVPGGSDMPATSKSRKAPQLQSCYGLTHEDLDIVVVEPTRTMQTILRSMLAPLRPKRLRFHESAADALRDMLVEPPNLIVSEWRMSPMSGNRLLRVTRHRSMAPLCFAPFVVVTGAATRSAVEQAFRLGAHAVMVKPCSPMAMRRRVDWLLQDDRPFVLKGDSYVIDGVSALLDTKRAKEQLPVVRAELLSAEQRTSTQDGVRSIVDKIIEGELLDGELPEAVLARSSKAPQRFERPSPTLERLIRRRAQARDIAPARSVDKAPTSGRSRWSELWSRHGGRA